MVSRRIFINKNGRDAVTKWAGTLKSVAFKALITNTLIAAFAVYTGGQIATQIRLNKTLVYIYTAQFARTLITLFTENAARLPCATIPLRTVATGIPPLPIDALGQRIALMNALYTFVHINTALQAGS